MTLPVLVNNYKEQVLVASAKKGYSNIINAITRWNADNGVVGEYNTFWASFGGSADDILKSLAKYMNAIEVCTNSKVAKCGGTYSSKQHKKINDGTGNTVSWYQVPMNARRIVLADGSFVTLYSEVSSNGSCEHRYFSYEKDSNGNYIPDASSPNGFKGKYVNGSNCGYVGIDTNGLKGPNVFGRDIFKIGFQAKGKASSSDDASGNLDYVMRTGKLIDVEDYTPGKFN